MITFLPNTTTHSNVTFVILYVSLCVILTSLGMLPVIMNSPSARQPKPVHGVLMISIIALP